MQDTPTLPPSRATRHPFLVALHLRLLRRAGVIRAAGHVTTCLRVDGTPRVETPETRGVGTDLTLRPHPEPPPPADGYPRTRRRTLLEPVPP